MGSNLIIIRDDTWVERVNFPKKNVVQNLFKVNILIWKAQYKSVIPTQYLLLISLKKKLEFASAAANVVHLQKCCNGIVYDVFLGHTY